MSLADHPLSFVENALFQPMTQRLVALEQRLGKRTFWILTNLVIFAVLFLLYGKTTLHGHGKNYYIRSLDFFLQHDSTRDLFRAQPGLENILLPFVGYVVRSALHRVGLEYTPAVFALLAALPYLVFIIAVCLRFRSQLGLLATAALSVTLFSSGLTAYMLTWGGYVDGVSYLVLFLSYLAIDRSLPLTLLLLLLGTLNHYLAVVGIVVMASSMFLVRPNTRYVVVVLAAGAAIVVSAYLWGASTGAVELARAHQISAKLHTPIQQFAEVYGLTPWNLLSAFNLSTIPLIVTAYLLLRRSKLAALSYGLPVLSAFVMIYLWVDVTRILTLISMVTLLYTLSILAPSGAPVAATRMASLLDRESTENILGLVIVCGLLGLFVPNYYVNNGAIVALRPIGLINIIESVGN